MADIYDFDKETGGANEGGFDPNEFNKGEADEFYLKLRERVQSYLDTHAGEKIAELVMYVPDFFYMLVKLMGDDAVPTSNKVQIGAAIAYFLSPLDIIPDAFFGLGWLDDLYIAMIVTDNLLNSVDISIVQKYWLGDADLVCVVKDTLDKLNEKLGLGAIKRILAKAGIDLGANK